MFNSATVRAQQLSELIGTPAIHNLISSCTEKLGNDSAWDMMSHTVVGNFVLELHEGAMVVCIAGINFQGLISVNKSSWKLITYELHVASYSLIILIVCVDSSGVNVYVMVVCLYVYM